MTALLAVSAARVTPDLSSCQSPRWFACSGLWWKRKGRGPGGSKLALWCPYLRLCSHPELLLTIPQGLHLQAPPHWGMLFQCNNMGWGDRGCVRNKSVRSGWQHWTELCWELCLHLSGVSGKFWTAWIKERHICVWLEGFLPSSVISPVALKSFYIKSWTDRTI